MKIDVTQEDIDQGQRYKSCLCPTALAVKRETGLKEVYVYPVVIQFLDSVPIRTFRTSAELNRFIAAFDEGKPVRPMSFELEMKEHG